MSASTAPATAPNRESTHPACRRNAEQMTQRRCMPGRPSATGVADAFPQPGEQLARIEVSGVAS